MNNAIRNIKQLSKHHVYGVDANGVKIQAQKHCARLSKPDDIFIVTEFADADEHGTVFRATRRDPVLGAAAQNIGLVPDDFVTESDWRMCA